MSPSSRHASKRAGCYRQKNNSIGGSCYRVPPPVPMHLHCVRVSRPAKPRVRRFFFKFLFCTFFRREVTRQGLDQHELGDCRERPLACMKKTPRVRRGNGTTAIWNGSHANFGNEVSPHTRERTTNGKGDETPSPRTSELENTSAPKWNMWCLVACSSQARNCFRGLRTRDMTPSLRTPHL